MEKERCKKIVNGPHNFRGYNCQRKAWKDGYCKQHHPDSVKDRDKKREERWKTEEETKKKQQEINDLKIAIRVCGENNLFDSSNFLKNILEQLPYRETI